MKKLRISIGTLKKRTREAIKELLIFFEKNPECFKSESDVKCYLYHILLKKIPYKNKTRFENDKKYYEFLVMTELQTNKKYKRRKSGRSNSRRYDLAVLDPRYLEEKLKPLVAIEIKFNVFNSLKKSMPRKGVYKDFDKLSAKANDIAEGHLIILNNYNYTTTYKELYNELLNYLDNSPKPDKYLYLWIRHVDYKTRKVTYKC